MPRDELVEPVRLDAHDGAQIAPQLAAQRLPGDVVVLVGLLRDGRVDAAVEQVERGGQVLRAQPRRRAARTATPSKKSRSALCMTLPATRWSSGCSTSRGCSWRSTNQSDEQVWNVSSSVTEYVSWPARRAEHLRVAQAGRAPPGRQRALDARDGAPAVRARARQGRRRVAARERRDGLQALALVVAVERVRRSRRR